jgi:hypothetical protein
MLIKTTKWSHQGFRGISIYPMTLDHDRQHTDLTGNRVSALPAKGKRLVQSGFLFSMKDDKYSKRLTESESGFFSTHPLWCARPFLHNKICILSCPLYKAFFSLSQNKFTPSITSLQTLSTASITRDNWYSCLFATLNFTTRKF